MIPNSHNALDSSNDSANGLVANSRLGSGLPWLVIAIVTIGLIALSVVGPSKQQNQTQAPRIAPFELSQLKLQGKTLIFQQSLTTRKKAADSSDQQKPDTVGPIVVPDDLDEGTINQRWCYAILLNELQTPSQALQHLSLTKERLATAKLKLDKDQERVSELLQKSFAECENDQFQQSNLKPEEVDLLREQLGWFADLLFAADKARPELKNAITKEAGSVFKLSFAIFAVAGLASAVGGVLVFVTAILIYFGILKPSYVHQTARHHLYLQTFAIWMLIFIGGQIGFELVLGADAAPANRLAWGMIPFLGSLVALVWPCFRGVKARDVLADVGWKMKNPIVEIGTGMVSYLMLLPFILIGLLIFAGLTALVDPRTPEDFSSINGPSHPIQEWVADDNAMTIPLIIVMACVAAPIVEETMFRGVFYRYLRDATGHRAWWLSIATACLVNSLIFAAIHPQGLMALPLLGTLAVGFSISREHRDSLIAPMVMHGINNGIITLMLVCLL